MWPGLSFHFLKNAFWRAKNSNFDSLIYNFSINHSFGIISKESLYNQRSQRLSPMYSFISLGFTCRSMIHIELILVYGAWWVEVHFLAYEYLLFLVSLVEKTTFLQRFSLVTLSKSHDYVYISLFLMLPIFSIHLYVYRFPSTTLSGIL